MSTLAREYRLLLAMALLLALPACATPLTYSAMDIHGQVVDAGTNQPIEGAVVVAQWVLFQIGIGHGGHDGHIHVHETVTGQDGRYVIPAWGPKPRPPMTELHERDPEILIFKSGYEPVALRNFVVREDAVRVSDWNWRVIRLKKQAGSLESYADSLEDLSLNLPHQGKEWKSFPKMVLALDAENHRLLVMGLNPKYRTSIFELKNFDESDREYLRKFKQ